MYMLKDFENNPTWIRSLGEKLDKIHFRNGHYHAVCDPKTGICKVHYDKHDPYESLSSLVNHLGDSNLGKAVLGVAVCAIFDQLFLGGELRKSIMKMLK